MPFEQIIWIGKYLETNGTSSAIQEKLDKYDLVHYLNLEYNERFIEHFEEYKNYPYYGNKFPDFNELVSDEGKTLAEEFGVGKNTGEEFYDFSSSQEQIYVSKYALRRKSDPFGVSRYEIMFPFGTKDKEDATKALVGLRKQYGSYGGGFTNNFSVIMTDIWPDLIL